MKQVCVTFHDNFKIGNQSKAFIRHRYSSLRHIVSHDGDKSMKHLLKVLKVLYTRIQGDGQHNAIRNSTKKCQKSKNEIYDECH